MIKQNALTQDSAPLPKKENGLPVEELPFRVILATSLDDLNRVTQIRQQAYGRHLPQFAQSLASPEPADFETDTLVLLALSKQDNAPLVTMRIHTNCNGPLPLEQAANLPAEIRSAALAEAVRFSVMNSHR
ncbi:MAG: hypothetical protein LZF84_06250, partial [Nitrosomonas sp.]